MGQGNSRTGVCPERMIVLSCVRPSREAFMTELTPRQRQVLEFIDAEVRDRGYPPSVREIGEAVGLSSTSTVHAHLAALQDKGFLTRDPAKPRAIEVHYESASGARSSGGRCATSPSSATSPRAPASSPPRTSRSRACPRGLHRRRPAVHAAGPRRLDDRRRDPRRRLRRRAPAGLPPTTATSSPPASRAARPR